MEREGVIEKVKKSEIKKSWREREEREGVKEKEKEKKSEIKKELERKRK